jgi:hypothetical protein
MIFSMLLAEYFVFHLRCGLKMLQDDVPDWLVEVLLQHGKVQVSALIRVDCMLQQFRIE